jgi:predicted nucleic acid-binding Zn ribbon protein
MPRYNYKCSSCQIEQIIFHSIGETVELCTNCEKVGTMIKLLTKPLYNNNKSQPAKVGDLTKDYIEQNREILEQEKREAKRESYESS